MKSRHIMLDNVVDILVCRRRLSNIRVQPAPWSRSCVLRLDALRWLSLLGGFEQAENSVDKSSKKSTETLGHRKLPSRCGFLLPWSSHYNVPLLFVCLLVCSQKKRLDITEQKTKALIKIVGCRHEDKISPFAVSLCLFCYNFYLAMIYVECV